MACLSGAVFLLTIQVVGEQSRSYRWHPMLMTYDEGESVGSNDSNADQWHRIGGHGVMEGTSRGLEVTTMRTKAAAGVMTAGAHEAAFAIWQQRIFEEQQEIFDGSASDD
ncbi:hypothetical protein C8R43DRAFT_941363 [Mycena crocata]|nr:hypothetical protein C8R43DRAFT_941363 [Mycena crocata]